MKKIIAALAIAALASTAYGQTITVVDGVVAINGEVEGLAGIEATSTGGYLGINSFTIPGTSTTLDLTAPFDGGVAIKAQLPNTAILGALGADGRVSLSGTTMTDITYSESLDVAKGGDLAVSLGIGDAGPVAFPVVPEPATGLMAAFGLAGLLGLRRRR